MLDGVRTVLSRELVSSARRPRTYQRRVMTLVCLLVSLSVGLPSLKVATADGSGAPAAQVRRSAELGFFGLVGCTGVLLLGFVPSAVVAGIAGERERGSLPLLLTTRLTSFDIIAGKLASATIRFVGWLAVGVPLLILLHRVGGIDMRFLGLVAGGLATTTFFIAALSAAVAVGGRTVKPALGMAVLLSVAWINLPLMLTTVGPRLIPTVYAWFRPLNLWLLASSPMSGVAAVFGIVPGGGLTEVFPRMMAYQTAGGVLLTGFAVARLRPASRLLDGAGDAPRAFAKNRRGRRPACGDDPMMWKERYLPALSPLARLATWLTYGTLFAVLIGTVVTLAYPAWLEMRADGYFNTQRLGARWEFNQFFLRPATGMLIFFLVLMLGAMTGESLELERTQNTWTVLLSTPLSGLEVLRAKKSAMLRRWRPLFAALAIVWGAGLAVGSLHPLGLAAAVAALASSTRAASAVGGYAAVKNMSKEPGLNLTLLTFFFSSLFVIAPAAASGRAEAMLLATCSPVLATIFSLTTSDEVRAIGGAGGFGGIPIFGIRAGRSGAFWLAVTAVTSPIILHLIAALFDRASVEVWDACVGRPVRPREAPTLAAVDSGGEPSERARTSIA